MNVNADEARAPFRTEALAPGGGAFVYAAGDRPLDGFTIKRGIGQGGFGEIYYALSDGGKQVALKLIRRHLDVELRGMQQCLNLNHPHLLDLYDIRRDARGDTWVVMEYVSGPSLADVLRTQPRGLPPSAAMSWFHGIAAAVAYLHDRGIVHRDLKPGNVFSSEGVVKVGDYGLSKYISCSRRSGHTESIGTVHYMAPEISKGCYGKEIDIYALGVILCEMLTGRLPFDGETVGEVLMKHLTDPPDLSGLNEPFRSVVACALEKDPSRRFASVHQMLAALPEMPHGPVVWLSEISPVDAEAAVLEADAVNDDGPTQRVAQGERPVHCEAVVNEQIADVQGCAGFGPQGSPGPASGNTEPVVARCVELQAPPEEPIFRGLRETYHRLARAWRHSELSMPIKLGLIVLLAFLLLNSAGVLLPLAVFLCVLYGCYYVVWLLVRPSGDGSRPKTSPPETMIAHRPPEVSNGHGAGRVFREDALRRRPPPYDAQLAEDKRRQLWAEQPGPVRALQLVRSMLVAAGVCAVAVLTLLLIGGYHGVPVESAPAAWLYFVSLIGVYCALTTAWWWAWRPTDAWIRRFVFLSLGLFVGIVAWALAEFLLWNIPHSVAMGDAGAWQLPRTFYDSAGAPRLPAMMAVWATVFALIRWDRQADPLRSSRLSLWSLVVCVAVAVVAAAVWHFPQPWLPMSAAAVSISVQLSAPWIAREGCDMD